MAARLRTVVAEADVSELTKARSNSRCSGRSKPHHDFTAPKSDGTYVEILTGYGNPDALIGLEPQIDQMGDGRDGH